MAEVTKKIFGHQKQQQLLGDRLMRGSLPSAMIFHGPSGIGKKLISLRLVQAMNCESPKLSAVPLESACGQCSHCVRSLEEKNEFIYNIQLEEKKSISVDQVRDIHHNLSLRTLAKARFVIVDPADALTVQAANSLLKVLEEPPENTYFILITDSFHKLLPTIRSRAQIFGFSKLTPAELRSAGAFSDSAVEWADGRFEIAVQLQNDNSAPLLNESLQLLQALIHDDPQDWKANSPWFFTDDKKRQLCFSFWSQVLQKKTHGLMQFIDWLPADYRKLSFIFESMEALKMDILRNVDKQLAVESFFYQLRSQDMR